MSYFNRRKKAFGYAFKGLKTFFLREDHPKIHALASMLVILLGVVLHVNFWEWLALIFCIALVLCTEVINSALEKLTDIASPEYSEKAGEVKDMAAGAVLITALAAALIGLMIFLPKILALL